MTYSVIQLFESQATEIFNYSYTSEINYTLNIFDKYKAQHRETKLKKRIEKNGQHFILTKE